MIVNEYNTRLIQGFTPIKIKKTVNLPTDSKIALFFGFESKKIRAIFEIKSNNNYRNSS